MGIQKPRWLRKADVISPDGTVHKFRLSQLMSKRRIGGFQSAIPKDFGLASSAKSWLTISSPIANAVLKTVTRGRLFLKNRVHLMLAGFVAHRIALHQLLTNVKRSTSESLKGLSKSMPQMPSQSPDLRRLGSTMLSRTSLTVLRSLPSRAAVSRMLTKNVRYLPIALSFLVMPSPALRSPMGSPLRSIEDLRTSNWLLLSSPNDERYCRMDANQGILYQKSGSSGALEGATAFWISPPRVRSNVDPNIVSSNDESVTGKSYLRENTSINTATFRMTNDAASPATSKLTLTSGSLAGLTVLETLFGDTMETKLLAQIEVCKTAVTQAQRTHLKSAQTILFKNLTETYAASLAASPTAPIFDPSARSVTSALLAP